MRKKAEDLMETTLERTAAAPAVALGTAIDVTRNVGKAVSEQKHIKMGREYWESLGPGLTTGASDDDPSGVATYSQTGAQYGMQLLWLSAFTFPLMSIVQEMCARIGLVTGQGLAANIKDHFPRWVLYICTILLLIANTFNIGADIGAMAKAVQLLQPQWSFSTLVLLFTIFSLAIQIFLPYEKYAIFLKYLALILASYVATGLIINLDWGKVILSSLVPSITFSRDQIILVTAILGTTISPYLFFWQTSHEVEEEILKGKTTLTERREKTTKKEIRNMRFDVWIGMFVSNLVMFFIIAVCAATLNQNGITHISTAQDAALALRPIAGNNAFLLFTIGIIGTGLLAIPVLAGSASYALSESFGWENGLRHQLKEANAFYGIIIISMLVGLAINFTNLDVIKALIYTAVINGLVAPVILVLIVLLASNEKIMGEWVNGRVATILGWFVSGIMVLAGLGAIFALFF